MSITSDNLHSLNKLKKDIEGLKLLRGFLSSEKRMILDETEQKIRNMLNQIDLFNSRFSDLGWCAYDSMFFSLIEEANRMFEEKGIHEAEAVLLHYFKNDVKNILPWLKNRSNEFSLRYDLILKAFDDHLAGRYYASVPLFLIIIDGAVNDFTKSQGFFAEGTDVTAWDCLVGCSDGLTKLKIIFNKGRRKTNAEEITLPYRNGILHGRDLNFGNEYVSCKCLALLFVIADWMQMKNSEVSRQMKFENELNPPPLSETIKKIQNSSKDKEKIKKWKSRIIEIGKDIPSSGLSTEYSSHPYVIPIVEMFEAWGSKNYGRLSQLLKNMFSYEKSDSKRAGECRDLFQNMNFSSFQILEVEERGCCLSRILVSAKWEHNQTIFEEPLEFGCTYQSASKNPAYPWNNNGTWTIYPWKVQALYK